jgi:hypothetical protein
MAIIGATLPCLDAVNLTVPDGQGRATIFGQPGPMKIARPPG